VFQTLAAALAEDGIEVSKSEGVKVVRADDTRALTERHHDWAVGYRDPATDLRENSLSCPGPRLPGLTCSNPTQGPLPAVLAEALNTPSRRVPITGVRVPPPLPAEAPCCSSAGGCCCGGGSPTLPQALQGQPQELVGQVLPPWCKETGRRILLGWRLWNAAAGGKE